MWKTALLEKIISFLNLRFRMLRHTSSEATLNENNNNILISSVRVSVAHFCA